MLLYCCETVILGRFSGQCGTFVTRTVQSVKTAGDNRSTGAMSFFLRNGRDNGLSAAWYCAGAWRTATPPAPVSGATSNGYACGRRIRTVATSRSLGLADRVQASDLVARRQSRTFDCVLLNAGCTQIGPVHTDFQEKAKLQLENRRGFKAQELIRKRLYDAMLRPTGVAALDGFATALEPYVRSAGISVTHVYPGPLRTRHVRHYADYDQGRGTDPERILPTIDRGVARRKQRILPDRASRLLYHGSLVPGLLPRLAHPQYRNHLGPTGVPEDVAT